jgi:hypothetical protein
MPTLCGLSLFTALSALGQKFDVVSIKPYNSTSRLGRMRKALPVAAGIIAVAGPLMVGLLSAPSSLAQSQNQQQLAALTFEIGFIKVSKSMSQDASLNDTPDGGLEVVNQTLRTLIDFATIFGTIRSPVDHHGSMQNGTIFLRRLLPVPKEPTVRTPQSYQPTTRCTDILKNR